METYMYTIGITLGVCGLASAGRWGQKNGRNQVGTFSDGVGQPNSSWFLDPSVGTTESG